MRAIGIIVLIFLLIVTLVDILARKVNKDYVLLNIGLNNKNELFKKSILFIKNQLQLTLLKDCPVEEKETIVKEMIEFIDDMEKVW